MDTVPPDYNAHSVEGDVLTLWRGRRLPPAGGVLGPPSGPAVRQYVGAWTQGDFPSLVAHRAVVADVDARYLELVGRRAVATLRQGTGVGPTATSAVPALLTALGVWTGGDGTAPWDSEDRHAGVQAIVGRLASKGILVTRDGAFRMCPSCGSPRSPERIIYEEREGDTFLVRFPVRLKDLTVNVLVWVDVPWKLLGTSALLVNPDLTYVIAGYRRRDDRELVLTSKSSLDRLRTWIPEASLEVVEEHPGRALQGTPYSYPLRHEFPIGGDLTAPGGTILVASDVTDTGTGIVPLVPGHGPTDGRIAARTGVTGWPLVTPKGKLDFTLLHKYAGLDLESANEFVLRDLSEAGALLARLRVKRGVPRCAICGTSLLWAPGRAWCLEPSHLPPERRELFSRLLPEETLPDLAEVAPWPVSEALTSEDSTAVALLECARCDRLAAPDGPVACPCGGQRTIIQRRLLPSSGGAFSAWARFDPFPDGDSVHLYVGERRRVPSLVNHLAALSGVQGFVGEVNLTVIPTVAANDAPELVVSFGADAVRAAFIRSGLPDSPLGSFAERCRQESDRIRRWWVLSQEVLGMCDPSMLAAFARPIGGFLGDLEVEDRAILARWERTRTLALAHYDHWAPALVHRRAFRFLDNDLVQYRKLVAPRLGLAGTPTTKRAALRTLAHLLRGLSEVLAPILPFTSEAMHRALAAERTSVFEQPMAGLDRALLNDELVAAWDRWGKVLRSVDRFRRSLALPRTTVLPSLVLVVSADDLGDKLRAEKETLARLAGVQRFEVASPREPWTGRQRTIRPIEAEIQKAYPSQASQIVHLLSRMAPRRWETAVGHEELTVVIDGQPRRIFPNMVALSDTLPDRVVPVPCSIGELYLELPAGADFARARAPPLSGDAFWLVRRIERRLRSAGATSGAVTRIALVTARDPLATELRVAAEPIARYLGLRELRVVEKSEGAIPPDSMSGRTRTGDRWWIHIPDLSLPPRHEKRPRTRVRMERVSTSTAATPEEFDYSDEKFVAHEEAVRALGQELDDILGVPLLGPSKVAGAWEQGIHSVDDLRHASFETVTELPGFGGPVAEAVFSKLGGTIPPASTRRTRPPPLRAIRAAAPEFPARPVAEPAVEARRSSGTLPALRTAGPVPAMDEMPPSVEPVPPPVPNEPSQPIGGIALPSPKADDLAIETSPPATDVAGPEVREEAHLDAAPEGEIPNASAPPEPILPSPEVVPEAPVPTAPTEVAESTASAPVLEETPGPTEIIPPASSIAEMELTPAGEPAEPPENPMPELERPSEEETAPIPPRPPEGTPEAEETEEPSIPSDEVADDSEPLAPELVTPEPTPAESVVPEPFASEPVVPEPVPPESVASVPAALETPPPEPTSPEPVMTEPTEGDSSPPPDLSPPETPSVPNAPETPSTPGETPPSGEPPEPAPEATPPIPEEPPSPEESPNDKTLAGDSPSVLSPTEATPPVSPESEVSPPMVRPPEIVQPLPRPETELGPSEVAPAPPLKAATPSTDAGTTVLPTILSERIEPEPAAPPSGIELMIGDSLVTSLGGFLEAASAGHHGVCVVRESPERIRARVGSRPVEVFWLTNIGRGPALRPSDLEGAWSFLTRKLLEEQVTAFFLEGVEYLVRLHGADVVLTGLVQFDRLARENDARIWVYLAPSLMKTEDLERFRATFGGAPAPT
ncbi:MAG: class I tRNA ligase family protein [Thermoplasmata archaeon]|jgi:anticodon-binding protein